MKLYVAFIASCMALVFAVNAIVAAVLATHPIWLILVLVLLNFVVQLAFDALFAFIIHNLLPRKWFNPRKKIFAVRDSEKKFYDAIKIVKWKDKIPESGGKLAGFDKKSLANTKSEYLYEFLIETCLAEIIHYAMLISSVINLFVYPFKFFLIITLPLSLVNFVVQIPPILIQRYNRPRLLRIYDIQKRREANAAKLAIAGGDAKQGDDQNNG